MIGVKAEVRLRPPKKGPATRGADEEQEEEDEGLGVIRGERAGPDDGGGGGK